MLEGSATWVLLAAVILFVGFVLLKTRLSLAGRDPSKVLARKRIVEAKARAREAGDNKAQRARAWRDAAHLALDDLKSPNLAASFARRAERADPEDTESLGMIALAMRRGRRYRALEKLLWRRLAEEKLGGPLHARALQELIALYEGPLKSPDQAHVLRSMSAHLTADHR